MVYDMESVEELKTFLEEHREYVKTLDLAEKHEREHSKEPNYLGWRWFDVRTEGVKLKKLVINDIIKINFKSNSATCYLLKDRTRTIGALIYFLTGPQTS